LNFLHFSYSQCDPVFLNLYAIDLLLKFDHALVHLVEEHNDRVPQLMTIAQRLSDALSHRHPVEFL
jgi:hypothetical protein